jgi:hypothetical protein
MAHFTQGGGRRNAWPIVLALGFVLGNLFSGAPLRLGVPGLTAGTSPAAQAAPRPDGGGQAALGRAVVPQKIQVQWSKTLPTPSTQERQAEQAALQHTLNHKPAPVGPVYHLTAADTAALARTAGPPLPKPQSTARTAPGGPQDDSSFEETSRPVEGELCPPPACSLSYALSPSVANEGKYVLMTGNWFAATSSDFGGSWSALDPFTLTGDPDFCCNQQVLYELSRDTMFWELEYFGGNGSSANQIDLLTALGTSFATSCLYRLPPTSFGLPTGYELDALDIEYSANYLYLSFNAYDTSGNFASSTVARLPLSPMAPNNGCASVTPQYVMRTDNFTFTLVQGATDTMYWLSNWYTSGSITTGNHVRVFFWPESTSSYTYQDKTIDPFAFIGPGGVTTPNCASQDGKVINWCSNLDSSRATLYRSRAGYRGFGAPMLGMAWGAGPVRAC